MTPGEARALARRYLADQPPPAGAEVEITPAAVHLVAFPHVRSYPVIDDPGLSLLLVELLILRSEQGHARYGLPLRTRDGRDTTADLVAEIVDALFYATKAHHECPTFPIVTVVTGLVTALETAVRSDLEHLRTTSAADK